jgi:molybdopterin-guanine dinucleotide biosynthesis protein A
MTRRSTTLGLTLAGGRSQRMGEDKAFVELAGRPLLAHALARLSPQCDALAISANGDQDLYAAFGLPVLRDAAAHFSGPLAGILAGLDHAQANGFEFVATLPVDVPFAPDDMVARLHEARAKTGARVAVAVSGGRQHHAAALWSVSLADDLRGSLASGERSVHRTLARWPVATAEWPDQPTDPFFNVNTPDDLRLAETLLRAKSGPHG